MDEVENEKQKYGKKTETVRYEMTIEKLGNERNKWEEKRKEQSSEENVNRKRKGRLVKNWR
jgi:hypothetical protein